MRWNGLNMMAVVTVCNQIDGTRAWSPFSEVRERPVLCGAIGGKGSFYDDWTIRRFAAKARRLSERLNSAKDVPVSPLTEIA